jgi:hypothetical protein
VIAAGLGDRKKDIRLYGGCSGRGDCDALEQLHPMPESRGEDLFELGQRADRRLLDAGDRASGGGSEADCDGDGLLVVQQQRWKRGSGTQAVAGHTRYGVHRVAEVAELVDVTADRSGTDTELGGQRRTAPVTRGLEQREQLEEACGGFQHVLNPA